MIRREVLSVEGEGGLDRKAIRGRIIAVGFTYQNGNAGTNATLFEQVDDYRRTLAAASSSATDTVYPLEAQSKDETATDTGSYEPPGVAGDVVLEVDSGDSNQVTRCYLWLKE